MGTERQNVANRENAKLSTGPKSDIGKAVVSQNATQHGIFCNVPVLSAESRDEWDTFRLGVVENLNAVGGLEVAFAERAALLLWRLARLARYEAETTRSSLEALDAPRKSYKFMDDLELGMSPKETPDEKRAREELEVRWQRAERMLPNEETERKVTRYESHLGRQLTQTLHLLERLQATRGGNPPSPPAALDVTVQCGPGSE